MTGKVRLRRVALAVAVIGLLVGAPAEVGRGEYEVVLDEQGSKRRADRELTSRQARHDRLDIRPLDPQLRLRYADEWRAAQARFVDEPDAALEEADRLVEDVMVERGYPIGDVDRQMADHRQTDRLRHRLEARRRVGPDHDPLRPGRERGRRPGDDGQGRGVDPVDDVVVVPASVTARLRHVPCRSETVHAHDGRTDVRGGARAGQHGRR